MSRGDITSGDPIFEQDKDNVLLHALGRALDGDYQKFTVEDADYIRNRLAEQGEVSPQDAAQEVFVRGFKGLRSFRFRSTPFTWLYRTTRNVCNEFNRARRTEPLDDEPQDPSSAPERDVSQYESARQVRQLVAGLPDRQREVVVLRIFEDMSVKETAQSMGCREGTVKALLHKATEQLKTKMQISGTNNE